MGKPTDQRGVLDEEPFASRITKDKKVFISWRGRQVTTLSGRKADKFITDTASTSGKEAQFIMAKATGHFMHGNERGGRPGM